MKLSPDLYYALAQEYVTTEHFYDKVPKNNEKPELRNKFILSGKELLTALYTIISKTNCVQFSKVDYSKVYRMCNSKFHRYKITERIVIVQVGGWVIACFILSFAGQLCQYKYVFRLYIC